MRVLIACERSGVVREAFMACGHDAWSCDILPTDIPGQHIVGDAIEASRSSRWDLMVAHPPCTFLANSSAKHLYIGKRKENGRDDDRWRRMLEGALFFKTLLEAPIQRIAVENPIMLKYAKDIIGVRQSQIIHPWMFCHPETKATCLWLKNLPALVATKLVPPDLDKYPPGRGNGYNPKCHYESPGADRGARRSKTLIGIARAMAEQWSPVELSIDAPPFDSPELG